MFRRAFLALLLCTCGPKDDGDGSTTAGSASDETAASTAEPTGGACEDPQGPIGPAVEVKITNTRDAAIFVDFEQVCTEVHPFTVGQPNMPELKLELFGLEFDCSAVQGGQECGVNPGCPVGRVVQISPGATYVAQWSGGFQVEAALSAACAGEFCGGCWIEEQAPPGTYVVRVAAGGAIQECDPCESCEPNADGWCLVEGALAETASVELAFDYPDETSIAIAVP